MEYYLNIIIIVVSFVVLVIFKRTRNYASLNGLLLLLLFLVLIATKIMLVSDPSIIGLRTDNFSDTLLPTAIFLALGMAILFTIRHRKKRFKILSWTLSLFILYFPFGFIQQLFFQGVFTDTLSRILDSQSLVIIFSSVFYSSFHWGWGSKGLMFGLQTLFVGIVWSTLFLTSPNIFILGATHAVLASTYYFIVREENILEKRFNLRKRGILKLLFQ